MQTANKRPQWQNREHMHCPELFPLPTTTGDTHTRMLQADACTHTHQLFAGEVAKMLDQGPEILNRSLLRACLSIQRVCHNLGGLMKL